MEVENRNNPKLEGQTDAAPGMEVETRNNPGLESQTDAALRMEVETRNNPRLECQKDAATGREVETRANTELESQTDAAHGMEDRTTSTPRMEGSTGPKLPLCHARNKTHKKLFVDDLTLLEKISLSSLIEDKPFIGPQPYHGRFNLTQPPNESILQHQLQDLVKYTKENHMVLNSKKTKCIPFNNSQTKDFIPKLSVEEVSNL